MSSPDFFPDQLEPYKPKPAFPFDDRPKDDWNEEDYSCPFCSNLVSEHSIKQLVRCALNEINRGEKVGISSRA
ncbi:MAG: hypothetical protein FJ356_03860 [Thaumarchaeota archaeon]|nr:hypothetical protein [Nitrososphaerota archaeon]